MTGASSVPILHWYDLTCPFCYVAQSRTELFTRAGFEVVAVPFQAHPDIPPGGLYVGPRRGPMYAMIDSEAAAAGLALNWPTRIPNSRMALAAAEWVRRHQPEFFDGLLHALFEAHFVLGEDIAQPSVVERHAAASDVDAAGLHAALAEGDAYTAIAESEQTALRAGVTGTPAWVVGDEMIAGLQPRAVFDRMINRHKP